jgi:hypothetical protein
VKAPDERPLDRAEVEAAEFWPIGAVRIERRRSIAIEDGGSLANASEDFAGLVDDVVARVIGSRVCPPLLVIFHDKLSQEAELALRSEKADA